MIAKRLFAFLLAMIMLITASAFSLSVVAQEISEALSEANEEKAAETDEIDSPEETEVSDNDGKSDSAASRGRDFYPVDPHEPTALDEELTKTRLATATVRVGLGLNNLNSIGSLTPAISGYLELTATGSLFSSLFLLLALPETGSDMQIVEAYSIIRTLKMPDYITAEVINEPVLGAGETLALYGICDGVLCDEPEIYGGIGTSFDFCPDEYDGFALVKIRPSEQTVELSFGDDPDEKLDFSFDGVLPAGASAEIEQVEGYDLDDDEENVTLMSLDISIKGPDGRPFQPEDGKPITITVRGETIKKAIESGRYIVVYHYKDGNTDPEIITDIEKDGDGISFEATGFSVYVIKEHENDVTFIPRVEFHFIDPSYTGNGTYTAGPYMFANQSHTDGQNDGNYFWTQIVRNGETLTHVPTPADINNSHFEGWYVVNCIAETVSTSGSSGTYTYMWPPHATRQAFDVEISVSVSGSTVTYGYDDGGTPYSASGAADNDGCMHVYLAPLYVNYRFLDFYDYDGNIVSRQLLVLDSDSLTTDMVSDIIASNPNSSLYFMGWSTVPYNESTYGTPGGQNNSNIFRIYEDGYVVDTYITVEETSPGFFNIYEGQDNSGSPKITGYDATGGSINMYAEFEVAHWLRFVSGESGWGALYVPADYLVGETPASHLPTTTREGYTFDGWYTGYQTSGGSIVYVDKVTDSSGNVIDNISVNLITSDNNGVTVTNTGSISSGELTMTAHSYLYAKWTSNATADYTVIIWMQKGTDDASWDYTPVQFNAWKADYKTAHPSASDSEINAAWAASGHHLKNYDYYSSDVRTCTNISAVTGSSAADRSISVTGFHLANTVDTYISYDIDKLVDPQGKTVFNVYYDRNVHTYTFMDDFAVTTTNTAGTTYFGKLDDTSFFQLTRNYNGTFTYYEYTKVDNPSTSQTYYGIVNDYVQVTYSNFYQSWRYNNTNYTGNLYTRVQRTYTGTRYYHSNNWVTVKEITAVYGHDISSNFPIVGTNGISYNHGERWDPQNGTTFSEVIVIANQMQNEDVTFRLDVAVRDTKTLMYYVEALSSDPADQTDETVNGVRYKLFNSVTVNVHFITAEDYIAIYGYTKNGSNPAFGGNGRIEGTSTVKFYYLREKYSLTFMMNYPGGATFTQNGGATAEPTEIQNIPFGTSMSQFSSTPSPNVPDHYVFDGWYEDSSGTQPFDFDDPNGIQGSKIIYARWYPIYYLIRINPNGGLLAGSFSQDQASYFWLQYGQTIGRYDTRRDYIEVDTSDPAVSADMLAHPENYYYYRYVDFQGFEHAKWSGYNVADLYYVDPSDPDALNAEKDNEGIKPSFDRLAEYISLDNYHAAGDDFYQYLAAHVQADPNFPTESTADYWDSLFVDTGHVYRVIDVNSDPIYSLVGWYRDGEPYDFTSPVIGPVTLTAVWRQSGRYRLHYSAEMTEYVGGTRVFGTLSNSVYDPVDENEGYSDLATAIAGTAPNNITGGSGDGNVYIFEGWRIVNTSGQPLDENGNVVASGTGRLYQPGDVITVRSAQSFNNVIYIEAYYSNVTESARRPNAVSLTLDSNTSYGGSAVYSAVLPAWVHPGHVGFDNDVNPTQILFGDTLTNVSVRLYNYRSYFTNANGYFLLGFDSNKRAESINFIPTYAADAIIGINGLSPYPNILYAIWEPAVYLTLTNDTDTDITFDLSGTDTDALHIVNEVTGTYDRESLPGTSITVSAHDSVKLVMPQGAGSTYSVTVNGASGYKLSVTNAPVDPATANKASADIYGTAFDTFTGTLAENVTGAIVTVTSKVPLVTFDVNGGVWDVNNGSSYIGTDQTWQIPVTSGDPVAEPTDEPTRAGFEFRGWSLTKDTTYSLSNAQISSAQYNFNTPVNDSLTLYAIWKIVEVGTGTVKIIKEVTGPGDNEEPFTYTITINGRYRYGNTNNNWNTRQWNTMTAGSMTVQLKHGQSVVITDIEAFPSSTAPGNTVPYARATYTVYDTDGTTVLDTGTLSTGETTSRRYWRSEMTSISFEEASSSRYTTTLTELQDTGNYISEVGNIVSYNNTAARGTVLYSNRRNTTVITIGKTLNDPLDPTATFNYSVTVNDARAWLNPAGTRTVDLGNDAYFSLGNGGTKNITVPTGAEVIINESVDTNAFAVSAALTNGTDSDGVANTVTMTAASTDSVSPQQTVTFTNTRNTVTVLVRKSVTGEDLTEGFNFTATLKYNGAAVDYDINGFTDGVQNFTLRDYTTYSDQKTITMPYGASLVITETVDEEKYDSSATGTLVSDSSAFGSYLAKTITLPLITETVLVIFTNNEIITVISPTGYYSSSYPYMWLFGMGMTALFIPAVRRKKRKNGDADD